MHVVRPRMGGMKALPGAVFAILTVFTSFQRIEEAAATDKPLATTIGSTQPPLDQLYANILPLPDTAVITTLEFSQQLSGFLRAQLVENTTNNAENTAMLKEQLSNFSRSLELFIERSHHARTWNQFEDSVQMFLTSVEDVPEAFTIRKMDKSFREGAATCSAHPLTGTKLLKWLRPFESLLSFVEVELINLETIILDERLQETITKTNVVTVRAESHLTSLIAPQQILLLSLQAEKDGVANVAQETVESIQLNCSTSLSNRGADQEAEILKIASNITERENRLKEELTQEKVKRGKEAVEWDAQISIQNEALEYERSSLPGKLQDLRLQADGMNILLHRAHQAELVKIQEACNARQGEKKFVCMESLSNLTMAQERAKFSWLTESQLKVTVCRRTIAELDISCNQLLTNLRSEHAQELERLQLQMEARENCTQIQEEIDDYYDTSSAEVTQVQISTEDTLSQLRSVMSELKRNCSLEIAKIDRTHSERKDSLRNDYLIEVLNLELYCVSLIANAKRTAQ